MKWTLVDTDQPHGDILFSLYNTESSEEKRLPRWGSSAQGIEKEAPSAGRTCYM